VNLAERVRAVRSGGTDVEAALTSLAISLIEIPSPTGEERAFADFLAALLDDLGWDDVTVDANSNLVARVRGARPGPRLMFLSHADTFAPGSMSDPYTARVDDGEAFGKTGPVVRGLGANTPKGVIAAMLLAADQFVPLRADLDGEIILAVVTRDLLANNDGIRDIHEAGVEADFVIAGEPTGNRIAIAARGIARYEVRVTGVAAHAGTPHLAVNPVPLAARLILDARDRDWGQHERLGPATMTEIAVVAQGNPPLSPESCAVTFDCRPVPGADPETIRGELQGVADRVVDGSGATVAVERTTTMYPLGTSESEPFMGIGLDTLASLGGEATEPGVISFATNGGYTAGPMGAPTFCFGPGDIADAGERSHVAVRDLEVAMRFYGEVAGRVLPGEG
jgi:succinyl-diaminopimelate desuccinylase